MNKNVFREYDIRGIVKEDFDKSFTYDLGRAYASYLIKNNQTKISISGDIRKSTLELKSNFISGLLDSGLDVYDLGIIPTPLNYFSLFNTDITNSVQITGSHNPPEFNGFKLSFNKKPFFGKDIQHLMNIIENDKYVKSSKKASFSNIDVIEDYKKYIINNIKIESDISCVMDCGNATGSLIAPQIFKDLGISTKEMYCTVDEKFPNHHPDPTIDKNLDCLVKEISNGTYSLGVAFDGDADRMVSVDENGQIIRSDILMAIFVSDIIKKNDSIVYDVKCSRSLRETIIKYGGKPVMYKTGHSLIKNKMIELNCKFGGEMSGHLFFADRFFGFDDGIYASLRLIELLSKNKKSLSELVSEIPRYHSSPEIRIDCSDDREKIKIVNKVIDAFKDKYNCNLIDGIRIEFEYGWALVRWSNTQPAIVCRFEADNSFELDNIQNMIFDKIEKNGNVKIEF